MHRLDFARWFLEAAVEGSGEKPIGLPRSTSASGGKYYFDDAQEWPDTMLVTYDYPGRLLTYEMRVWAPYPLEGEAEGAAIFGDKGYLIIGGRSWRHFGPKGVLIKEGTRGGDADKAHVRNFLDCMRSRGSRTPTWKRSDARRACSATWETSPGAVGRTVKFDYDSYSFVGDDEANALRTRAEYRKPYVLPKVEEV